MNSKEDQTNAEISNLENESSKETEKDKNFINKNIEDEYKFGWSSYSEITNGRFAMRGCLALILIELFSQQSFLKWTGIFN